MKVNVTPPSSKRSAPAEATSVFDTRSLQEIYDEIKSVYAADNRPWVVGYSGGKDSTTTLQLIWHAVAQLPKEKRTKPIYVISSDTLVETPAIVGYIDRTLDQIAEASVAQGMPFTANKVTPKTTDTFWVNLIGRGYPAPQKTFRWCTDRLKIQPADQFIIDKVSEHGEAVLVLGVRKEESMTRAQVMNLMKIKGSLLSRHSKFAQVLVYTPIESFTVNDVWSVLLQNSSPWGSNNRDLAALYRNASGECPLVVDTYTPSCGGSRFGCWTCTVVTKDKSMEAMIDSGEGWMQPLLDYRDFLASTHELANKKKWRSHKRRDGHVKAKHDGSGKIIRGPYHLWFCKELLERLLTIQAQIQREGPDPNLQLISAQELAEIRRLWRMERGDWEDSVPTIVKRVTGKDVEWIRDDHGSFSATEAKVLYEVCNEVDLNPDMVVKLLEAERQLAGMSRRSTIYTRIDSILREDWRSEEDVLRASGEFEEEVEDEELGEAAEQ